MTKEEAVEYHKKGTWVVLTDRATKHRIATHRLATIVAVYLHSGQGMANVKGTWRTVFLDDLRLATAKDFLELADD